MRQPVLPSARLIRDRHQRLRIPSPPLPFILRHVHRNAIQIRRHQRLSAKVWQRAIQPQKHLLRQIIQVLAASRQPQQCTEYHRLMLAHDLFEAEIGRQTGLDRTLDPKFHAQRVKLCAASASLTRAGKGGNHHGNVVKSPFIVPLGAFLVAIVAIISGITGQAHARRIKAEQRMAMVQRGMTAEQIDRLLRPRRRGRREEMKARDPLRSLGKARRAGIVLVSVGAGIFFFGLILAAIERDRDTLIVAATGLIPLAIGIGFFVDYTLQKRELAHFGLEVAADPPCNRQI